MVIAACTIQLHLEGIHSLKGKRRIVKSLLARLSREFNVATAEVAFHDVWQSTAIGLVTIGTSASYLHGLLERAVLWIEANRPDTVITDYAIEFR